MQIMGEIDIVKSYKGYIFRHPYPGLVQRGQCAGCRFIIPGKNCIHHYPLLYSSFNRVACHLFVESS